MSRYIDADAIQIPSTHADMFENCRNCKLLDEDQVREIIDSAPSIEIVRCRECIFDTDYYFKNDIQEHRHEWCYEFCDVDGYCPFGKKRSEREDK